MVVRVHPTKVLAAQLAGVSDAQSAADKDRARVSPGCDAAVEAQAVIPDTNFTRGSRVKTGVEYHLFYRSPPVSPVAPRHTAIWPQISTRGSAVGPHPAQDLPRTRQRSQRFPGRHGTPGRTAESAPTSHTVTTDRGTPASIRHALFTRAASSPWHWERGGRGSEGVSPTRYMRISCWPWSSTRVPFQLVEFLEH